MLASTIKTNAELVIDGKRVENDYTFRYHDICILAYGYDVVQPDTLYYLCNVFTYQLSTFHDTEL